MSIRLIAKDLYHLIREVEALEKEIASAPAHRQEALRDRFRRLKAERDRVRQMLEGSKDTPAAPRPK